MKKEINVRPHVNEIQKQDKILKPMSMKPCSLKNFNKMYNSLHKSSKKNKKTFLISGYILSDILEGERQGENERNVYFSHG